MSVIGEFSEADLAELRESGHYRSRLKFVLEQGVPVEKAERYALEYADRQLGMTCGRCRKRTGNNNQGHYWKHCKVTGQMESFHFCCPDDCQLVAIREGREETEHAVCGRPQSEHAGDECPPPL